MAAPQTQRGLAPATLLSDSTNISQLQKGLMQCHRSPDFINMAETSVSLFTIVVRLNAYILKRDVEWESTQVILQLQVPIQ